MTGSRFEREKIFRFAVITNPFIEILIRSLLLLLLLRDISWYLLNFSRVSLLSWMIYYFSIILSLILYNITMNYQRLDIIELSKKVATFTLFFHLLILPTFRASPSQYFFQTILRLLRFNRWLILKCTWSTWLRNWIFFAILRFNLWWIFRHISWRQFILSRSFIFHFLILLDVWSNWRLFLKFIRF